MILIQLNSVLRKEKKEKKLKIWLHVQKRKKKIKEAVTGERLHAYYTFYQYFVLVLPLKSAAVSG